VSASKPEGAVNQPQKVDINRFMTWMAVHMHEFRSQHRKGFKDMNGPVSDLCDNVYQWWDRFIAFIEHDKQEHHSAAPKG
jgi:hypothetical protein